MGEAVSRERSLRVHRQGVMRVCVEEEGVGGKPATLNPESLHPGTSYFS